jgi:putative MFS transporter
MAVSTGVSSAGRSGPAEIAARLDRLPTSKVIWELVLLLSLGGVFEFYDLFFTGYLAPALIKGGFFTAESLGPFASLGLVGVAGFGTFVFATFAGLWVGTLVLGHVADRFGRRSIFTMALLWYSISTFIMAFQHTGFWLNIWRFIAGIGVGIELVTIDAYLSELVPPVLRGRAYAINQTITFGVVPVVAFIAWLVTPHQPLGVEGWRWVVVLGSIGALVVWFIRLRLPESPRWLANHGRMVDAERIVSDLEAKVAAEVGGALPPPGPANPVEHGRGAFADIWVEPYRSRTIMLSVFNFFQTIGFYGFAAWVPTLLIANGVSVTSSLAYAFVIAIANPFGPLLGTLVADKIERKWQICLAAFGMGVFMLLFATQHTALPVIIFGICFTLCANWLSFSFHNYQSELYPTSVRSRAIGFVYSWSRISAAFAGLMIGAFLHHGGVIGVAFFIAFAMAMVIISIGVFGPRTRGLALEQIAH